MINYSGHTYTIKDALWLENQRHAGAVAAVAMRGLKEAAQEGKSSKELDTLCETIILDHQGCKPTFKGYKGFPGSLCCSINKELVHGIPSERRILKNGDVVKLDLGVTFGGAIADMARTIFVGEEKTKQQELLYDTCVAAFDAAIRSFKFTKNFRNRLGTIGYAIKREAAKINASIIDEMGGHGLDFETPHSAPFVYNVGDKDKGPILYPNTTIAIEPMLVFGSNAIHVEADGWTVTTQEIGVHYEDTVFIHEDRVEIIT